MSIKYAISHFDYQRKILNISQTALSFRLNNKKNKIRAMFQGNIAAFINHKPERISIMP